MSSIGVIGAGTWGIALARMLANTGCDVTVWSAIEKEIDDYSQSRRHPNLPGMEIPVSVGFTKDIAVACRDKDILLFAVPSVFVRSTAAKAAPFVPDGQIIVDVAKGIEPDTLYTMTQVIADELKRDGHHENIKLVALSGPTHAEEVAKDRPTTIISACEDIAVAEQVQDVFMNTCMRVYTNVDVLGVELCGALKNIIALAAGIAVGLGFGDNTKAAIITRGMAEITRLGTAMGCMERTFSGLAGIGDLIVTATSVHSRNNRAGNLIGQGYTPKAAIKEVGMVVEGVNALPAAMILSERYSIEMPIVAGVNEIINAGKDPAVVVRELMTRRKKTELNEGLSASDYAEVNNKHVVVYGTFDAFGYEHISLLKNARAHGGRLTVALAPVNADGSECGLSLEQRRAALEAVRYVDLVVPINSFERLSTGIKRYSADILVVCDEFKAQADLFRAEGVEVICPSDAVALSV